MMLRAPELEKKMGICAYGTDTRGIRGRIRAAPSDFLVQEVVNEYGVAPFTMDPDRRVQGSGRYLLAVLVKRRWDTLNAIRTIARQLNLGWGRIGYAGLKDSSATTSQFITVQNVSPARLRRVHRNGLKCHPYAYVKEKLTSKRLIGNKFTVRVRGVRCVGEDCVGEIEQTLQQLDALGGMPNYFGHQRFGTIRPITHLVGENLVKRRLKDAVLTYLTESFPGEASETMRVRSRLLRDGDYARASRDFPRGNRYERVLARHLALWRNDYQGALRRLPHTLLRLFLNAYQAYLFNRVLSLRMERLSLDGIRCGDWVAGVNLEGGVWRVQENNLGECLGLNERGLVVLALPLFGYKTFLSGGPQGGIEREVLGEENVSLKSFYVGVLPNLRCEGGFRPAIAPVHRLQYRVCGRESVELNFTLGRGSYATILLREFMKPSRPREAGF